MTTSSHALARHGQSPWVDHLSRWFVQDGDLAGLIDSGVFGLTSNPTIFAGAIADDDAYDDQLRDVLRTETDGRWLTMAATMSVHDLLDRYGTTYAHEAGITLRDKPAALYQLLVLTTLLSVRVQADLAVGAARELFRTGWRTPGKMAGSTWQQRVDALGRAHYVRYDESTATALGEGAERVLDEYRGDLRLMRAAAAGDVSVLRAHLTTFRRIGETGSHIFCREAQVVWPELRPHFDSRALRAAGDIGLPTDPRRLADRVDPDDVGRLAAALVRYGLANRGRSR